MKYKYAIMHEDGTFWNRNGKEGVFYFDSAALFEKESHAKEQWEVLPYFKAIKCKVVELCVAESVNKTEVMNAN